MTCAICGKVATHIRPPEGRCRAHKDVETLATLAVRHRLDAKHGEYERANKAFDEHRSRCFRMKGRAWVRR